MTVLAHGTRTNERNSNVDDCMYVELNFQGGYTVGLGIGYCTTLSSTSSSSNYKVTQISDVFECNDDGTSLNYFQFNDSNCNPEYLIPQATQYNLTIGSFTEFFSGYGGNVTFFNCDSNAVNNDCIIELEAYYIPFENSCEIDEESYVAYGSAVNSYCYRNEANGVSYIYDCYSQTTIFYINDNCLNNDISCIKYWSDEQDCVGTGSFGTYNTSRYRQCPIISGYSTTGINFAEYDTCYNNDKKNNESKQSDMKIVTFVIVICVTIIVIGEFMVVGLNCIKDNCVDQTKSNYNYNQRFGKKQETEAAQYATSLEKNIIV